MYNFVLDVRLCGSFLCIVFYMLKRIHKLFCSSRVSNELGAGNPVAAQLAVGAGMVLAVLEAIIVSTALFCCRNVLGYAYSNEEEVVSYVSKMVPLLCLRVSVDSLLGVLSGRFLTFRSIFV